MGDYVIITGGFAFLSCLGNLTILHCIGLERLPSPATANFGRHFLVMDLNNLRYHTHLIIILSVGVAAWLVSRSKTASRHSNFECSITVFGVYQMIDDAFFYDPITFTFERKKQQFKKLTKSKPITN